MGKWRNREKVSEEKETELRRKPKATGSLMAKIIAFFLLGIFCFTGIGTAIVSLYIGTADFYSNGLNDILMDSLYGESRNAMYEVASYIERGEKESAAELCRDKNIDFELFLEDANGRINVLWDTGIDYDTKLTMEWIISFDMEEALIPVVLGGHILNEYDIYGLRIYINPDFPEEDEFQRIAGVVTWVYNARYDFIKVAVASVFLCIVCFVFLLCSAGHHNDREGIVPGVLTGIPLDVLTFLFFGGVFGVLYIISQNIFYGDAVILILLLLSGGTALAVLLTFYFMDLAIRAKLRIGIRHSLVFMILRWIWRVFCWLGRSLMALAADIPMALSALVVYLGICIVEFILVIMVAFSSGNILLWGLEKVILLLGVMYIALTCRKLMKASEALAEGRENYEVDTSGMIGAFKEHGENLNSLGKGIAKAVEERMRSEHLKTELITNVSHDIKTPLTSIINYADLICEEAGMGNSVREGVGPSAEQQNSASVENARIAEYAEVLLRQSRRLKKLLEDLVEASKATTGNLEIRLEPCEVGVLLSQAAGEYQQRMAEKDLNLITRQPEKEVEILADGRRLWRVFDNLLNNICKYAQENSRVYLSVETRDGHVWIIFRNMSKYPLDIPAGELEERFVRGDKSRHMEGNGLGLSIAKSLVELQNGRMEITTDGDLFKVTLSFSLLSREPHQN